jgi:hypothetical protein
MNFFSVKVRREGQVGEERKQKKTADEQRKKKERSEK